MIDLTKINQHLPPGLEDTSVEFYVVDGQIKCLHAGKIYAWQEIPQPIKDIIDEDMVAHPEAIRSLMDWDIQDADERMRQYVICRFGGFDGEADINTDGKIVYTEYFDCGRRGQCKFEGKLCATIKVENGHLTKTELQILRHVAAGMPNKLIADKLFITEATVTTHNQNIQGKLGVFTKQEMVAYAIRKNII